MGNLYECLLRMRNVSGKIYRENTASQFIFNNPFLESRAVFEIMWETNCRKRQASDNYTAHALCMLDNKEYRHAHPEYVVLISSSRQKAFANTP